MDVCVVHTVEIFKSVYNMYLQLLSHIEVLGQ